MVAIRFKAEVHDGVIEIPDEYKGILVGRTKVMIFIDEEHEVEGAIQYSDEYIEKHWREMIATVNMGSDFEKSDELQAQRTSFLMGKYK